MYIDAYYIENKKHEGTVYVSERDPITKQRNIKQYQFDHVLYYEDPLGTKQAIDGTKVSKYVTPRKDILRAKRQELIDNNYKYFEDDIKPEFRVLEEQYFGKPDPQLQVMIFDIEADFHATKGYAPVEEPFNKITAISMYLCWCDQTITFTMQPDTITVAEAASICAKYSDCYLFDDEKEMLRAFTELANQADVITGWNSTGYDIPYTVNRINLLFAADNPKDSPLYNLCLFGQKPKKRKYVKFKKESITYDLIGIVHLDYLELYQKHNQQQLHSYTLDFVGQLEVGESKVAYDKTLDHLYKYDYEKFLDYSRQDVNLLAKIHYKKKFIELANQVAHSNCVTLRATMGSVALITHAIALFSHAQGKVIPGSKIKLDDEESDILDIEEKEPAIGAYVADPKTGLRRWIGAIDINSLYPSILRSLNMSPETLFGQIKQTYTEQMVKNKQELGLKPEEIWIGEFACQEYLLVINQTDDILEIEFDDSEPVTMTAKELYAVIFHPDSNLVISANGTIFRKDIPGIIPSVLSEWYSQRKSMQKKEAEFESLVSGIELTSDILELLQ